MFLTETVSVFYDALLTLAYPQACLICGRSVEKRSYGPACVDCWHATRIFAGNEAMCWKCGALARTAIRAFEPEEIRCQRCESQAFAAARACGVYEGALRESVLRLKRQPTVPKHLVSLLIAAAKRPPLRVATRIVPVPLHPDREARRGFNQALVIAKAIGLGLGLVVDEKSLVRVSGSYQYRAGLDAKGRLDTVTDAFAVRFPQLIRGEILLLVDDVFTTGATASSCAAALVSAGATEVHVLTLARPAH